MQPSIPWTSLFLYRRALSQSICRFHSDLCLRKENLFQTPQMSAIEHNYPDKRPYRAGDKKVLYQICIRTANAGHDARHIYRDTLLLGDLYLGSYLHYQPEMVWVMEDSLGLCGYLAAVSDTVNYQNWFLTEWLPEIQKGRQAQLHDGTSDNPDDALLDSLFDYSMYRPQWLHDYPAHFHIALLEHVRGMGNGSDWIQELFRVLQMQGCPGVHLGMHPENHSALSFFKKIGFRKLEYADLPREEVLYLGKNLKPEGF